MSSKAKNQSEYRQHNYFHPEKVDAVFLELWEAGEVDTLDGGVHPTQVEAESQYCLRTIRQYFRESDKYEQVHGISPGGTVRASYARVGEGQ